MAKKKDLPVKVVSSKTGEEDVHESLKMFTNNRLSRGAEEVYDKKPLSDAKARTPYGEYATKNYPGRTNALESGAKASVIKRERANERRGKKRK